MGEPPGAPGQVHQRVVEGLRGLRIRLGAADARHRALAHLAARIGGADRTRDWYAQFTAEAYAEATGTASQLFEAPAARIPAGPRRLLMAALTVTGTRTALARAVSMRTMLHHPMAFEAFNRPHARTEQIRRMARGANLDGPVGPTVPGGGLGHRARRAHEYGRHARHELRRSQGTCGCQLRLSAADVDAPQRG